ncbi:Mediator of RNA polymerase II transcription subunit 11 [Vitis vinifera]|uniref:Mediator of RNA polymerase II transcription subunit 11 n=1 Tax=Vitis vinifera TaxID=29760 RepID=A0A438C1I0_VITVI|nr:Mediator of RNA polymerase II transcription subunit 11 [Vitis vinifera]
MDSQTPNTSLQRLQNVEKRIIKVLELAGGVMDELCNPSGPRKELLSIHCGEFMQLIKGWLVAWIELRMTLLRLYYFALEDIQMTLRDEIKSACEYRPFEKCDYISRISNEICCKKLEYVISQLDGMKETIDEYHDAV